MHVEFHKAQPLDKSYSQLVAAKRGEAVFSRAKPLIGYPVSVLIPKYIHIQVYKQHKMDQLG